MSNDSYRASNGLTIEDLPAECDATVERRRHKRPLSARRPAERGARSAHVQRGQPLSSPYVVNDRVAANKPAVIDVTRKAAEELDFAKSGKAKVKVEVQK